MKIDLAGSSQQRRTSGAPRVLVATTAMLAFHFVLARGGHRTQ